MMMLLLKKILGLAMLLIGLSGIAVSVLGLIHGHRLVDNIGNSLDSNLDLASQSLNTVEETLLLAKTTVGQASHGLETAESATLTASQTISQAQPLLDEVGQVATQDVPNSLETVQTALPSMAQTAAIIDDTLTALSNLSLEQRVLGIPIYFNLGIDYAPEVPFEESVNQIGTSLEDIPPRLRGLQVHIDTTADNLETLSQDMAAIAADLDNLNASITEVEPLLNDYLRLVTETNDQIQQMRANLPRQLGTAKLVVTIALAWIGLTQIAPLYLGWQLAFGRRRS